MVTTIQVEDDTWERLRGMKSRGESFDDVVNKLIKSAETPLPSDDDGA